MAELGKVLEETMIAFIDEELSNPTKGIFIPGADKRSGRVSKERLRTVMDNQGVPRKIIDSLASYGVDIQNSAAWENRSKE
ncbi:hypothetical protein ACFOEK_10745 [Litoribrevibacter euphylliae]|uniref:Uncharacterized protein n=1 Tax=Litoribrevibacter euphylliae TaxID=1834034 RepID=A0ABV7HC58_9GAMM